MKKKVEEQEINWLKEKKIINLSSTSTHRNVNEKETYPRLTDHWMAENITDKPSTG